MGKVAEIIVPPPEPFCECEDGAQAKGAAYTFKVPTTATEPLVMEVADGTKFLWTPTELCYRDEHGNIDFITGSAPVQLEVRGREARYRRTFPASDEVHIAQPEGRKYWLILYEPPRPPASYLQGEIWFGVSGIVAGIPLPPGVHKTFNAFAFDFRPPFAADLMEAQTECWYEVVDTENGQMLFIWCRADWLLNPDRVYPVKIDPTVVVNAGGLSDGDFAQLPNGTLLVVLCNGLGRNATYHMHISLDGGTTWRTANTSLGSGRIPGDGHIEGGRRLFVDNYGNAFWIYCTGFKVSGMSLNIVKLDINGTNVSWGSPVTLDSGNYIIYDSVYGSVGAGNPQAVYVGFVKLAYNSASSYNGTEYAIARFLTISSSGAITLGSATTLYSKSFRDDEYELYAVIPSVYTSGAAFAAFYAVGFYPSPASGGVTRTVIHSPSGTVSRTVENYLPYAALNGYSKSCWLFVNRNKTSAYLTWWDAQLSGVSFSGDVTYIDVTKRRADGKAVIALALTTAIVFFVADLLSEKVTDSKIVETSPITPYYLTLPKETFTMSVPVVYASQTGSSGYIYFDQAVFNTAPLAPTLHQRTPFDATQAAVFSWTFRDDNQGDNQSKYQLQIVHEGTTVYDSGEVQSPYGQHLLPGGTLENGRTYQWRVRTADQAGEWSPWSDYAVFQTGPKPVVTILYPTSDTRISAAEVTVQWSVSDQSSAIVRLYDAAGSTVLQEHEVTTPSARTRTITGLENNTSYQVSVQVTSAIGVQGDEVFSGPFSVQYTPPPKPEVTAEGQQGFIRITITNPAPTGDEPEVTHNDIYRREPGQGWVRVATGIEPGGTYNDYAAASGVLYEYRVRAIGANGAHTDSDVAQASVTITGGIWLHDPRDPAGTVHWFQYHELPSGDYPTIPSGKFQFAGRNAPVVQFDASQKDHTLRYRLYLSDETDDRQALEALYWRRTTLCLRNHRGKKYYVTIDKLPLEFERRGAWADVEFQVVDFDEEV